MSTAPAAMSNKKPFLVRAIWEWLNTNNVRPHVLIDTQRPGVQVPPQFRQQPTVFNIAMHSTEYLLMGDEAITCRMRFNGKSFEMVFPMDSILAVFSPDAPCIGQGMSFELTPIAGVGSAGKEANDELTVGVANQTDIPSATPAKKPNPFRIVK